MKLTAILILSCITTATIICLDSYKVQLPAILLSADPEHGITKRMLADHIQTKTLAESMSEAQSALPLPSNEDLIMMAMSTPKHDQNAKNKQIFAQMKKQKKLLAMTQNQSNLSQSTASGRFMSLSQINPMLSQMNTKKGYENLEINERSVYENGKIVTDPVIMTNIENSQYVIKLGVGCDAETRKDFMFILDTGSTTILLVGEDCTDSGCLQHQSYKQSPKCYSRFSEALGNRSPEITSRISYGKGDIGYKTKVDDFYFGSFRVDHQPFADVYKQKIVFNDSAFDGLIGLGYKELGMSDGMSPIFEKIIESKQLKHNVFCIFVSRLGLGHSRFFLGGCPSGYILGGPEAVNIHPVEKKTWWGLKLDKVLFDGVDSGLCHPECTRGKQNCCLIIMDTGSTCMASGIGHTKRFNEILQKNTNKNDITTWPVISVIINEKEYTLDPEDYLSVNGDITYADRKDIDSEDNLTSNWVSFNGHDEKYEVYIAGDSFLSKYMTWYNRDNDTMGIFYPDLENIAKIQQNEDDTDNIYK